MNGASVSYKYAAFVSYSRSKGNVCGWVRNHFHPLLEKCLQDEIGTAHVYIDEQLEEQVGKQWPQQLATALGASCLLVPVLSGPYFESEWCMAEWETMAKREEVAQAQGLIYPVVYSDTTGEESMQYVNDRQLHTGLQKYALPTPKYVDSANYEFLFEGVRQVARNIVDRLDEVPAWSDAWPVLRPPARAPKRPGRPRFGAP